MLLLIFSYGRRFDHGVWSHNNYARPYLPGTRLAPDCHVLIDAHEADSPRPTAKTNITAAEPIHLDSCGTSRSRVESKAAPKMGMIRNRVLVRWQERKAIS